MSTVIYSFGGGFILGAVAVALAWMKYGAKATAEVQSVESAVSTATSDVESLVKK